MEDDESSSRIHIPHVIPFVGTTDINLYPPADKIYEWLRKNREIARLHQLRHLGSLAFTFSGARQARWDYTAAMLYYCEQLNRFSTTACSIEQVEFSSYTAALQSICLLWNIGHLPGTFAVEKGVYRFLYSRNPKHPASELLWPQTVSRTRPSLISDANRLLIKNDYQVLSRVLASIKIFSFRREWNDFSEKLALNFALSFFLESNKSQSKPWEKIVETFTLIRHLAYLTIDAPYTGLAWSTNVPALVIQMLENTQADLRTFTASLRELLSPLEKLTYDILYHSRDARKEVALVAERTFIALKSSKHPQEDIVHWASLGLFSRLKLSKLDLSGFERLQDVPLRSHFASPDQKPAEIESAMMKMGITHPVVVKYNAWNSDLFLKPDELIIDAISIDKYTSKNIGKLIIWIMENIDSFDKDPADLLGILVKNDLERAYVSLASRALNLQYTNLHVEVTPWSIDDFGLFPKIKLPSTSGAVWATSSKLDDKIAKHIMRKRNGPVPNSLRKQYAELTSLRVLRDMLREEWSDKQELRQRFLLFSSSVKFCDDEGARIEFDGGLMKISTRSGKLTWYGLETKTGRENPLSSIRERIVKTGLHGKPISLSNKCAVFRLDL